MGCGAGKYQAPPDAVPGTGSSSSNVFRRFSNSGHEESVLPEGIVLCQATRPDWGRADYLVFESKDHLAVTVGSRNSTPGLLDGTTSGSLSETIRSSGVTLKKESQEKGGRYFSKRQDCIGTWKIMGNVLTLVWPFSLKPDTVIATKGPRQWTNKQTNLTINVMQPEKTPDWFTPDVIADKFQSETVSSKAFECPVCYFELFKFPAGVIRMHSRRCCGHYFHKDCAQYLLRAMRGSGRAATCPICGVSFSEVKMMPDLMKDPRDWFAVCDVDFGGELDPYEVVEAVGTVLPVNRRKLEKNVKAHWHEWDPDGDGTITLQEFITPGRGLKDWIMKNLTMLRADDALKPNTVPSIDRNPREWFHYWDRDGSGTLEKDEVVRALLRTFCRDENGHPHLQKAHDMREVCESLWEALGHSPFDSVSFEDFVRPCGLMDQFLHNQTHTEYFGLDAELVA
jgi:Ca2+-binding EF-hand superfamily protein